MAKRPMERPHGEVKPPQQLFSLRLSRQLWAELGVAAKLKRRSMNDLITQVLQEWWEVQEERPSVARLVKASGTRESGGDDS